MPFESRRSRQVGDGGRFYSDAALIVRRLNSNP